MATQYRKWQYNININSCLAYKATFIRYNTTETSKTFFTNKTYFYIYIHILFLKRYTNIKTF